MSEPDGPPQLEVTQRFLRRFADLMSNGSNATNLLLAAELLEAYAARAHAAEERLRLVQSRITALEAKMTSSQDNDQIALPLSILRLAKSQFESLSDEFEKSGNVISQAMCAASAFALGQYLEAPQLLHSASLHESSHREHGTKP